MDAREILKISRISRRQFLYRKFPRRDKRNHSYWDTKREHLVNAIPMANPHSVWGISIRHKDSIAAHLFTLHLTIKPAPLILLSVFFSSLIVFLLCTVRTIEMPIQCHSVFASTGISRSFRKFISMLRIRFGQLSNETKSHSCTHTCKAQLCFWQPYFLRSFEPFTEKEWKSGFFLQRCDYFSKWLVLRRQTKHFLLK